METVIKQILKKNGTSVHAFHKKIGGNRTLAYQIANGFYRATRPQQEKISNVLGAKVDELFDGNGMPRLAE
jgi:lambda repressor-like predicted transcriptional regulator